MAISEEAVPREFVTDPETGERKEVPNEATLSNHSIGSVAVETVTGKFEPSEQLDQFDTNLFPITTREVSRPQRDDVRDT